MFEHAIRDMKNPTKQEIFDYVHDFIVKQGAPAGELVSNYSSYGNPPYNQFVCDYIDVKGRRCAVGALMNDVELTCRGNQIISGLLTDHPNVFRPWFKEHEAFLAELQRAHDGAALDGGEGHGGVDQRDFVKHFKARMDQIRARMEGDAAYAAMKARVEARNAAEKAELEAA